MVREDERQRQKKSKNDCLNGFDRKKYIEIKREEIEILKHLDKQNSSSKFLF